MASMKITVRREVDVVQRYRFDQFTQCGVPCDFGLYVRFSDYQKLEAENARLRQQRDAANAQLDFLIERGVVPKVTKSNMDEID